MIKKQIEEGRKDFLNILRRLIKRDFSGNAGIAIKNSAYQFSTGIVAKAGSLIFTIILARILLPELFGLYTLALSTILFFAAFSDLGIGDTLVRFVSRELGKGNISKAMSYSKYLIKIKIFVTAVVSLILILLSKIIAENYYHKPIYLALLAGGLYIFIAGFVVILQSILQAHNIFKPIFYRELLFQSARLIIIPMLILFAIKNSLSDQNIIFLIIISLDVAYLLIVGLFYLFLRGNIFKLDNSKQKLSKRDKKRVNRFILIISFTILSGIFFGYMDVVILGYFVSSEYIGYYQGAFSFISAIVPLITFSSALLPIFSRLQKRKTQDFLKKAVKILSIISILCFLFLFLASKYLVLLLFGAAYYNSINILRIFSLLLLTIPVITIYSTYFTSSGRPGIVSMLLAISTTINLTLIYLFISYLIKYNPLYAVYGTAIATVISRYLFMFMLMIYKRKN